MPKSEPVTVKEYEPPFEISSIDVSKYAVFLEHHLGESEVSKEALLEHIRIKGKLPAVGDPLFAIPKGAPVRHKKYAIPYGRVRRVETKPHG